MRVIMYHYVKEDDNTPPFGYYHLYRADFQRQLDHFQESYHVLDRETFLDTIRGERDPRQEDIVLTFDDGLKDHYRTVLQELIDRNIWGLFYVPAGPYLDNKVLDVHRIHSLLGACGGSAVLESLKGILDETMISPERREEFSEVVYVDQDNTAALERTKRLLNYYVDESVRAEVLDTLERELLGSCLDPADVYMTRTELKDLFESGMHVGSHTTSHPVMSTLSRDTQKREISRSFELLSDILGSLPIRSYCHPYGGAHSYTSDTLDLLREANCSFGFDVDSRPVTSTDLTEEIYCLPRYDCNEFPHGETTASLGK